MVWPGNSSAYRGSQHPFLTSQVDSRNAPFSKRLCCLITQKKRKPCVYLRVMTEKKNYTSMKMYVYVFSLLIVIPNLIIIIFSTNTLKMELHVLKISLYFSKKNWHAHKWGDMVNAISFWGSNGTSWSL